MERSILTISSSMCDKSSHNHTASNRFVEFVFIRRAASFKSKQNRKKERKKEKQQKKKHQNNQCQNYSNKTMQVNKNTRTHRQRCAYPQTLKHAQPNSKFKHTLITQRT